MKHANAKPANAKSENAKNENGSRTRARQCAGHGRRRDPASRGRVPCHRPCAVAHRDPRYPRQLRGTRSRARGSAGSFAASSFSGGGSPASIPAFDGSSSFEAGTEEGSVLAAALRNSEQAGGSAATGAAPSFAGLPPESEAVAVPITMNGQVVAAAVRRSRLAEFRFGTSTIPNSRLRLTRSNCSLVTPRDASKRSRRSRPPAPSSIGRRRLGSAGGCGGGRGQRRRGRVGAALCATARLRDQAVSRSRPSSPAAANATSRHGWAARLRARACCTSSACRRTCASSTDYFHDELVRTLANGDASLLEVRT